MDFPSAIRGGKAGSSYVSKSLEWQICSMNVPRFSSKFWDKKSNCLWDLKHGPLVAIVAEEEHLKSKHQGEELLPGAEAFRILKFRILISVRSVSSIQSCNPQDAAARKSPIAPSGRTSAHKK